MSRQHHNPGQPPPPTCPALKSAALRHGSTDGTSVSSAQHRWNIGVVAPADCGPRPARAAAQAWSTNRSASGSVPGW
jgi:hypothetical protein